MTPEGGADRAPLWRGAQKRTFVLQLRGFHLFTFISSFLKNPLVGKCSVSVAEPTFWHIFSTAVMTGKLAIFTDNALSILAKHEGAALKTRNWLLIRLHNKFMIVWCRC